jgi:hypothetical protein
MTRKCDILLACSLFLLAACSDNTPTEVTTEKDASTTVTPDTAGSVSNTPSHSNSAADITRYIETDLPGWKEPESSSWEKYWYARYKQGKNTVFRVQEDFDGNGRTDYAYILKDSMEKHAVWAFMGNDSSYIKHRIYEITRLPNSKLHVGLALLKAGSYNDLNTTDTVPAKVQTVHPAIHVIFFETASKAYYWKDGSFHLIQTGD